MTEQNKIEEKKKLYDHQIMSILNKQKISESDLILLGGVYSRIQKIEDSKYRDLEKKRLLIYARNHPEYVNIINKIVNQYSINEQEQKSNNNLVNIYDEVQSLINEVQKYLSSENLNDKIIQKYIEKLEFKMHEVGNLRNQLSEADFNRLTFLLSETINNCDQTMNFLNEEKNNWTR